jgi:glutathione peroxidase-family protein
MTRRSLFLLAFAGLALAPAMARAAAAVGDAAPDFTLQDSKGAKRSLSSYKGKVVVLEWVNYECPFVKKHYGSGNMQKLESTYTGKGVVWFSINSSAPGNQGYFAPDVIETMFKERKAASTAYLIDSDGRVGRSYGAKTTPHMFVIDASGKVVYAGGIDDKPSTDLADIAGATNFVRAALDETLAGKPVTTPTSTPYGCSVKY